MYTVGLINKYEVLRTFTYSNLEEARKELKSWEKIFRLNNNVKYSTTIIERDALEQIAKVKIIFEVEDSRYIMFMCSTVNCCK